MALIRVAISAGPIEGGVTPSAAVGAKRLRLRWFTIPETLARTGRVARLHLAAKALWADLVKDAVQRLRALAVPG